jgi:hypothetical protein
MLDFLIQGFEARRSGRDCLWQSVRCFSLLVNGLVSAEQAQYLLSMVLYLAMSFGEGKCLPSGGGVMMIFGHTWC